MKHHYRQLEANGYRGGDTEQKVLYTPVYVDVVP